MTNYSSIRRSKAVSRWLLIMVFLVIAMIILGGATRLTNSGLSITEWKPITGAIPPLSAAEWAAEFEKYKQIPEFAVEHSDMDLEGFRFIFFMEWAHRQLGRIIGLAYAVPLLYFFISKQLPTGKSFRFFVILILIGVQGGIGWWMVASGLVNDRVDVSQYRLATHLGMAFVILGFLYWTLKDQREGWSFQSDIPANPFHAFLLSFFVFLQIIFGAFVAGTHAGKAYNSWPMMDGDFIPSGYGAMEPYWKNFTENIATIQFNHRTLAYIILILAILYFFRVKSIPKLRRKTSMLLVLLGLQTGLGVWTLLNAAPLNLALAHQFLAVFVFLSAVNVWRSARLGF